MYITIQSIDDIRHAARQFIEAIGDSRVFAFYGGMGAGKTTFIKAICEELGVAEQVTSPTFAIVNVYEAPPKSQPSNLKSQPSNLNSQPSPLKSEDIYHFDFYRVKHLEEAIDMGCEEYFFSGSLCFIEWPELVEPLLPEDVVRVTITQQADGQRVVESSETQRA